jgi:hypothetical protein
MQRLQRCVRHCCCWSVFPVSEFLNFSTKDVGSALKLLSFVQWHVREKGREPLPHVMAYSVRIGILPPELLDFLLICVRVC